MAENIGRAVADGRQHVRRKNAKSMHSSASSAIPSLIVRGASFTFGNGVRGRPRNVMPKALTKQVTASAAVSASAAPHSAKTTRRPSDESATLRRRPETSTIR